MSNEMITQLPTVVSAQLSDIIYAVQGYVSPASPGTSVQETLQQVANLMISQAILSNAGNPNGSVAGNVYQLCYDTTNSKLYVCTTSGSASTAVWTLIGANVVAPVQGGTGVSNPTSHTIPVAEGSSNFSFLGPLTNGQLLIGNTGNNPSPATLTAGTNISIVNAAGSITISATGAGGFGWTEVTGTSQNMASNNGYIANNGALVSLALPTVSVVGDQLAIIGKGAGLFSITQGASQQIHVGSSASTLGAGGSVSSTNQFDSIYLVCTVANTIWTVLSGVQGNFTIV